MTFLLLIVAVAAIVDLHQRLRRLGEAARDDRLRLDWAEQRLQLLERVDRRVGITPESATSPAADAEPVTAPAPRPTPWDTPPPFPDTIVSSPGRQASPELPELPEPLESLAPDVGPEPDLVPVQPSRAWSFEQLFGEQLPVWGGGIALALAGFFLVKYSIDIGLITPAVRILLGVVFGIVLIAAAEVARRWSKTAADPRIGQALAGSGVAVLYAVSFVATRLYELVPPSVGFAGMAATTVIALVLALRHGPATALLGLLGGFATPALVASGEGSVPVLLGYLLLTVAGLLGLAGRQGWRWLAALALLGGFGWGALLLFGHMATADLRLTGLFLAGLALAAVWSDSRNGDAAGGFPPRWLVSGASMALAFVQLAFVVGKGGFGPLEWGLYGLLGAATLVIGIRDSRYRRMPLIGFAIGMVTLLVWPAPLTNFAAVAVLATLLFGIPSYAMAVRSDARAWIVLALAATLAPAAIAYVRLPDMLAPALWAGVALVAMAAPAWLAWRANSKGGTLALFGGTAVTALLAGFALAMTVPDIGLPLCYAGLALFIAVLAQPARDPRFGWLAFGPVAAALTALLVANPDHSEQAVRMLGVDGIAPFDGQLRYVLPGLALLGASAADPAADRRRIFAGLGTLLLAIGVVQMLPADWRPLGLAALALVLGETSLRWPRLPLAEGSAGVAFYTMLWMLPPVAMTGLAILGHVPASLPILVGDLPTVTHALRWLVLPAVLLLALGWRISPPHWRMRGAAVAALPFAVAGYVLLRQPFAIATAADFVARGFAERTLITLLLLGSGAALYGLAPRGAVWRWSARAATAGGLLRFATLDLIFYNPLVAQNVGDVPGLNWLLPAFLAPMLAVGWLLRNEPDLDRRLGICLEILRVVAVTAFALWSVRQIFHGGILATGAVGTSEYYAYSLAAIVTALVLLAWGARRDNAVMRVASLVLLLGAVGKVFLSDAAALEGLLRIASFLGLGISLIGVSWFYTRHVFARASR